MPDNIFCDTDQEHKIKVKREISLTISRLSRSLGYLSGLLEGYKLIYKQDYPFSLNDFIVTNTKFYGDNKNA